MIKDVLQAHEDLRRFLFIRGFLATTSADVPAQGFPFYGAWQNAELDYMDELTGVSVLGVIQESQVTFLVDPSGRRSARYGRVDGRFSLSSHPQLVADIRGLQIDSFVATLIVNMKETKFRSFALNLIFTINSILP